MARLKIPGEHLPSVWIHVKDFDFMEKVGGTGVVARLARSSESQMEYFPASRLDEIGARLQKAHDKILKLEGEIQKMRIWKKGRANGGGVSVQK